MNTVLEFEVVLANGTIVYANKDQNTDLFAVLKGGGNNFGVVTSYKMKAVPMGKVRFSILHSLSGFPSNCQT
jgi:FAD/FMN-containing dehydrogenase